MSGADFYSSREVVSRGHHRCEEEPDCRRGIKPGDRYVRIAGAFDGYFWDAVLCGRCSRLHEKAWALATASGWEGPSFGDLLSWLREWRGW